MIKFVCHECSAETYCEPRQPQVRCWQCLKMWPVDWYAAGYEEISEEESEIDPNCEICEGYGWTMEPDPSSPNLDAPEPMQVPCQHCVGFF